MADDASRHIHDLVVRGGTVILPDGPANVDVVVDDGRVSAILAPPETMAARTVIEAAGRYVLPGLIDSHVHFRTPGLTYKEDWAHGSRAAAVGGVTTVLDMPNTIPPLNDPAKVAEKVALIEGTSLVDFRFHLGAAPDRVHSFADLTEAHAVSVKIFMAGHHTAPDVIRDPDVLELAFRAAAERGVRLVMHAEDDHIFALLDEGSGPPQHYDEYEPRRPRSGGIVAVARLIELVRKHSTAVHVLHVSSAEEVALLTAAAQVGLPVTFEVTGHHLTFTAADTGTLGARIRLSPSIRAASDRDALWEAVFAGTVSTIGSDHAPHTVEEKSRAAPDAPPGIPGVQELAIGVLTGMRRRRPHVPVVEHLQLLAELLAARPAALFGIDHRKGSIEVGKDADMVVLDPDTTWMFSQGDVQSKAGWSAYEGFTMSGAVDITILRGRRIWDRASATFGPSDGQFLDAVTCLI
mgnify:CR=1 FL=1